VRFLKSIDVVKFEEVESFKFQNLLLREASVVEGQAPRQFPLLLSQTHQ
jgi:hypothetical protein